MSIKDYNKCLIIDNTTTNDNIAILNREDFENLYYEYVTVKLSLFDVMALSALHEAIDNDCECRCYYGYKSKKNSIT